MLRMEMGTAIYLALRVIGETKHLGVAALGAVSPLLRLSTPLLPNRSWKSWLPPVPIVTGIWHSPFQIALRAAWSDAGLLLGGGLRK
jgi:hypothetical protein